MIRTAFGTEKPVIKLGSRIYDFNIGDLSKYIVQCKADFDDDTVINTSDITGYKHINVKGQYLEVTLTVICPASEPISDFNIHYDLLKADISANSNICQFKEHADSDNPFITCLIHPPKKAHYQSCSLYDMYTINIESQEYI
jgi:hypothetical protein